MKENTLLEVSNLTKNFEGFVANEDLNLKFKKNEINCIIGPNGAGKTTFISLISGHLQPTKGTIIYKNKKINNLDVVTRAKLGIARKFQTPSVFSNLTVLENLELAILNSNKQENLKEVLDSLESKKLIEITKVVPKYWGHNLNKTAQNNILIEWKKLS